MINNVIRIENAVPRLSDIAFTKPVNWSINKGEHWAVIGSNGAGKTLLIDILTARYALREGQVVCQNKEGDDLRISDVIKSVAFRDIYSLSDVKNSYYQQRWNAGDIHDVPLVKELLAGGANEREWIDFLVQNFAVEDLVDKPVNLLSSGELRKFLIVRSLLKKPKVLILDNPFIGLDKKSREILNGLFIKLSSLEGLQIVLVVSNVSDIPSIITHVLPIKNKTIHATMSCDAFLCNENLQNDLFFKPKKTDWEFLNEEDQIAFPFKNSLIFKNIHIKYGNKTILNGVDWQVKRGEKWALLGENGAGKSTLLSLVSGDNPQAYANDITLFDRKRGSGESIWDIKKHIGYISPEMHLYYQKNVSCLDIVGSGFFDTIGLYRKCTSGQEKEALKWMRLFGVEHLFNRSFLNVSSGEQRLLLLARVFVKRPNLLILDEPLHGLDLLNKKLVKAIIEKYCSENKSLIYVTHYENEIPSVIDKRLILRKYRG